MESARLNITDVSTRRHPMHMRIGFEGVNLFPPPIPKLTSKGMSGLLDSVISSLGKKLTSPPPAHNKTDFEKEIDRAVNIRQQDPSNSRALLIQPRDGTTTMYIVPAPDDLANIVGKIIENIAQKLVPFLLDLLIPGLGEIIDGFLEIIGEVVQSVFDFTGITDLFDALQSLVDVVENSIFDTMDWMDESDLTTGLYDEMGNMAGKLDDLLDNATDMEQLFSKDTLYNVLNKTTGFNFSDVAPDFATLGEQLGTIVVTDVEKALLKTTIANSDLGAVLLGTVAIAGGGVLEGEDPIESLEIAGLLVAQGKLTSTIQNVGVTKSPIESIFDKAIDYAITEQDYTKLDVKEPDAMLNTQPIVSAASIKPTPVPVPATPIQVASTPIFTPNYSAIPTPTPVSTATSTINPVQVKYAADTKPAPKKTSILAYVGIAASLLLALKGGDV